MYSKIFLELITRGESGLVQTPIVFGRLGLCTFILPVAPSDADTIKTIAKREKTVLEDNLIMVSSFLVFTCFLGSVSFYRLFYGA
jgi:hypothetical protein